MPAEWFVQRGASVYGPYTGTKLKALAAKGEISQGDRIRKGAQGKAVPASRIKGLFDRVSEPTQPLPPLPPPEARDVAPQAASPTMPQEPDKKLSGAEAGCEVLPHVASMQTKGTTFKRLIEKATTLGIRLGTDSKAAAQLAVKRAERARIGQFTLPNAYGALGEAVHNSQKYRREFPDLYAKIDEMLQSIKALKQVEGGQANQTLSDGAKTAAKRFRNSVAAKALTSKVADQMRSLGEAAYKRDGQSSGPAAQTSAIGAHRSRLAQLDAEIAQIEHAYAGHVLTPRRIAIGGACVLGLGLMAFLLLSSWKSEPKRSVPDFSQTNRPPFHSKAGVPANPTVPTGLLGDLGPGIGRLERSVRRMSDQRAAQSLAETSRRASYMAEQRRKAADAERERKQKEASQHRKTLVAQKEWYLARIRDEQMLSKRALADGTHGPKIARFPTIPKVNREVLGISTPVREWETGWDRISELRFSPDGTALLIAGPFGTPTALVRFPSLERIPFGDKFIARGDDFPYFRAIDDESGYSAGYNGSIRVAQFGSRFRSQVESGDMLGRQVRFSANNNLLATIDPPGWDFIGPSLPRLAFFGLSSRPVELLDVFPFRSVAVSPKLKGIGVGNESGQQISDAQFFHDSLICLSAVSWGFTPNSYPQVELYNVNFAHQSCTMLSVWKTTGVVGTMHTSVKIGSSYEPSYRFAVNTVSGHVALLYENGMRIVDATAIRGKQSGYHPLTEWMFDDPLLDRGSVHYTSDGRFLLVAQSRKDKDARNYDEGDYWRATIFDSGYKQLASLRVPGPNQIVKEIRQDDRAFLTVQGQPPKQGFIVRVWSIPDLKMMSEIQTKWAADAHFVGLEKVVTGARAASQERHQGGDRTNVKVWDVATGRLLARITDRNVDCVTASIDGRYIVTGKERFLGKAAVVAVWDPTVGKQVSPDDEFAEERRDFFTHMHQGPYGFVALPAPPVTLERFNELTNGMTYDDVMEALLGTGRFEAEVLEVDEATHGFPFLLRVTITYNGQGEKDASCTLIFEGNAASGTKRTRLVKMRQEGLR